MCWLVMTVDWKYSAPLSKWYILNALDIREFLMDLDHSNLAFASYFVLLAVAT